jgi:hypothetical protein
MARPYILLIMHHAMKTNGWMHVQLNVFLTLKQMQASGHHAPGRVPSEERTLAIQ